MLWFIPRESMDTRIHCQELDLIEICMIFKIYACAQVPCGEEGALPMQHCSRSTDDGRNHYDPPGYPSTDAFQCKKAY